ncbi:MAG TPA: tetratricopeptide repeat protein, partial [bacterium]|nr:tetratricopeptide repeat protein [bacterium]
VDRAVESYGRVISEYPGSTWAANARELRASLEEGRGNFESAIEDYTALLKYASGDDIHKYRILLAGGYLASGAYSQARVELIPVIEAESAPMEYVANAIFMYAESFFLGGRPEEAIRWYDALIENFPDSELAPEAKLHMATCFEETGRLGAARNVTERSSDYPNQKVVDARMKSIDKKGLPIVQQNKKRKPPAKRK